MAGDKIVKNNDGLSVPNQPIIPYIIGDGIGPDIWKAASRVIDAAVEKAYNGEKQIEWKEVLAGQKAYDETGCLFYKSP
ncbi:isocitrate/isopropylmalate family dehydrogenase, partial [Staphylococcus arlettae]